MPAQGLGVVLDPDRGGLGGAQGVDAEQVRQGPRPAGSHAVGGAWLIRVSASEVDSVGQCPRQRPIPRQALTERELALDDSVEALDLWTLPRRAVLTLLYGTVYFQMHGSGDDEPPRPAEAEALIARLSYLVRLIARCPALPVGASAADVISVIAKQHGLDATEAVLYAHACEIFPEVRKGWYNVSGSGSTFVLDQPMGSVRQAEERDVLLSDRDRHSD